LINIQDISDQTLLRVITEGGDVDWKFFALKVMISRLKLKLHYMADDQDIVQQCCTEMRELLKRSRNVPNATKDLLLIIEQYSQEELTND